MIDTTEPFSTDGDGWAPSFEAGFSSLLRIVHRARQGVVAED